MDFDFVIGLDKIGRQDINAAGGKGANLGEIIKAGIPVPKGFVVTTSSFDKLIEMHSLDTKIQEIIAATNVDDTSALLDASLKLKDMILTCPVPPEVKSKVIAAYGRLSGHDRESSKILVSVRSSATAEDLPSASFAGQQASFLNVKGENELIEAIRKCWASLFEPRAIFYRAKHGLSRASIAVVVQEMINSEKSGIIFTIDPTTGENILLIEAIWGLGECIVGGEVSPDLYKVSKDKIAREKILDIQISKKVKMRLRDPATDNTTEFDVPENKVASQVLSEEEVLELSRYAVALEERYSGLPQDIEFAIENNKIAILQTRAITTSVKEQTEEIELTKGRTVLLKGIGASPGFASGRVKLILGKDEIREVQSGDIIVTTMTSPDLVPTMSKSAAIITDLGGRTCHAAIVSREMGIPAIVGTQEASKILKDGQKVTVDAYNGIIYEGETPIDRGRIQQQQKLEGMINKSPSGLSAKTVVKVKVNVAFAQRLEEISSKVDGVGLLRIEHMIAQSGIHPAKLIREGRKEEYVRILMDGIRPIANAFGSKPIWVRTLDARSDEFRNLKGGEDEPVEANPMLGWHGIRRSLDEPELLKAEFEAIRRLYVSEGHMSLGVMLPFVISTEEVKMAKKIAKEVGLPDEVKIGIMVETPACVMIIEELCKEENIDFASFGTNDLTQLILGIDRNNESLAKLSSAFHPAVLRSMKMVIDICNQFGVETSICGESGSSPEMATILVRYGIKSISCNMDAIDSIRSIVFQKEQDRNIVE
ncbi:MAG: phosphoenolpyruvate synthase [Ignavibacteriales bacterium]